MFVYLIDFLEPVIPEINLKLILRTTGLIFFLLDSPLVDEGYRLYIITLQQIKYKGQWKML